MAIKSALPSPPTNSTTRNTSADALTTTLIVKGLPLLYAQNQVSLAIHRLLGAQNVIAIYFANALDDNLGRHEGSATIRCLNASVYSRWCNKLAVPLLGKMVDFTPHKFSLSGAKPNAAARAHDTRPTREVIADEISAFQNQLAPALSLPQLEAMFQKVETQIEARLEGLQGNINAHTTHTVEASTTATATRQDLLLRQLTGQT